MGWVACVVGICQVCVVLCKWGLDEGSGRGQVWAIIMGARDWTLRLQPIGIALT